MARFFAWAFAALLVLPATGAAGECQESQTPAARAAAPQAGQPEGRGRPNHQMPKWWVEPKLRAEFGITDAQSEKIEAIWNKDLQHRTEARAKLDKLEAQLDQMMLDASADEAAVAALLDKVESTRTEVSKARVLMLYRINKVLTPDQRTRMAAKAKAMREQRDGRGDHR